MSAMKPQSYLKAKWWSKILLISALGFGALGVYLLAQLYFTNSGMGGFLSLVKNPFALAVIVTPFIVAAILNIASGVLDRKAQEMIQKHAKTMRRK
jgi:uncharacterized membrane protein